jgi:NitT/TauT family transport system substrate-binding protein
MRKLIIISLFLALLSACAGESAKTAPTEKIRLPMGYIPNVQYAPFYMAAEKGYFAEANLDVTFDYSLETNGMALVGANEVPFAVVSGEQVLMARGQGLPVVYVAAMWQDYPVGVAAMKGAGIRKPEDMIGRKIGIPGLFGASYVGFHALLQEGGLQESDLTLDSIGFSQVEALLAGQEDAIVIYANNEPVQLEALGYEIDLIRVSDYVKMASNGIITNESVLAENPELVQRLVGALLKGLADVLDDPDEAFEVSKKYVDGLAGLPVDQQEIQRQVLEASIEFWQAERLGYSDPEAWKNMQEVLLQMGFITEKQDLSQAYTNQFVP